MRSDSRNPKASSLTEEWRKFIAAELKTNSNLGKIFELAGFGGYQNKTLTLYFPDETSCKTAKGQLERLKKKLPQSLRPCDRVEFCIGAVPTPSPTPAVVSRSVTKSFQTGNPLQVLNSTNYGDDGKGNELTKPVLEAAVKAEQNCTDLYTMLKQRTENLAGGQENTLGVSFNWYLRVGGTRGFRELLLPVFHPVFGIPYIPASSLKGAVKAWAKQQNPSEEINRIFGFLEGKSAGASSVEILDAFPVRPCLAVDVATPQWHWRGGKLLTSLIPTHYW